MTLLAIYFPYLVAVGVGMVGGVVLTSLRRKPPKRNLVKRPGGLNEALKKLHSSQLPLSSKSNNKDTK